MDKKEIERLESLVERLDNSDIAQFVKLSQKTGKILWLNFLSGMAKGLGFTLGTTVVLAVIYKIISRVISMNIPYLTELLKNIVQIVQNP